MPQSPTRPEPATVPKSAADLAITPGLSDHPGHLARRLHQMTYVAWTQVVSERVTPPQFVVMHVLADHPLIDQTELSDRTHLDQSTIADVTQRLTTRGYIRRERNPQDRRRNLLLLTDDGKTLLAELRVRTAQMNKIVLGSLSDAEMNTFFELSQRVIESTERLIPKAPRRGRLRAFSPTSSDAWSEG